MGTYRKHKGQQVQMPEDLVRMALASNAILAVIPMQDILALDGHHRMNTPGTCSGNWHWRFQWQQLSAEQQKNIKRAIKQSKRS